MRFGGRIECARYNNKRSVRRRQVDAYSCLLRASTPTQIVQPTNYVRILCASLFEKHAAG